ncbi:MAG: D-glycero-alpha-D-manno-heptose 1-phosphate guanylyltransferase [Alphaproteobacteria bacterium MarineAlpha11_Bin1]|nr:MAG: D-glycero-alpha-D-manno-heptose 1-phosphate guanylyltransferase [Alphaproteobacteria bacterium MarineAlpha11_Bin1]
MNKKNSNPDLVASPDSPLEEVLRVMTRGGQKIVLIIDDEQHLRGIVTDYDIRVTILEGKSMDTPAKVFMNQNPMTVTASASEQEIFVSMQKSGHKVVPTVDGDGRFVSLHYIEEFSRFTDPDTDRSAAVVMAGGLGERLRPMTNDTPKPMLQVGGRPILFTLLDQLIVEEFDPIYVSVNYKSDVVVNSINDVPRYKNRVQFIYEKQRMGTAGSLSLLPAKPSGAFVLINGDLLTSVSLQEMVSFHKLDDNHITVALKKEEYKIPYGVAETDGTRIIGMQEKPAYSFFINTGAYVLEPAVIDMLMPGEPCDMTDLIDIALSDDARVGSFPVHEYWLDIGTPAQLEKAQEDYSNIFSS